MAITYYESEDAGAPAFSFSGSSGAYTTNIIQLMDAILVNGYGSKPGLGWTKVMTSEVAGSDRTVYKNNSAHAQDMFLLVQSNPLSQGGFVFQIADTVITPEDYSGYSSWCGMRWLLSPRQWKFVGDDRT